MERRARNMRPKRSRHTDFGPKGAADDDIFLEEAEHSRHAAHRGYDSSPITAVSRAASGTTSDAGGSAYSKRRSMGVKDMDGQLDRLNKQNFALKLELDHRREQQSKLQEQLEAMQEKVDRTEQLQEEHAELLRINTQLVEELERRDRAVEEAMDIICELEDKVVDMEERHAPTRPSTANADSGYAGTETHEPAPQSSPPEASKAPKTPHSVRQAPPSMSASQRLHSLVNGQTPARARREPSVLSLKKSSTHALRSVYLENAQTLHPVKSFNSLLSRRDSRVEEDAYTIEALDSPRLSVLSESSFPSLYSPKKHISPDRYAWEAADDDGELESAPLHFRQASINRVSKWISEGEVNVQDTPSKSNQISPPFSGGPTQDVPAPALPKTSEATTYLSLNDALSAKPSSDTRQQGRAISPTHPQPHLTKATKQRAMQLQLQRSRPNNIADAVLGEPFLPPTPDSASTHMLRASRSSSADERSLLDTTPASVKGYNAIEPGPRTAPKQIRSSIELNRTLHEGLSHRQGGLGSRQDASSWSETECRDDDDADNDDALSDTVKGLARNYDGFPDPNSILAGTPSRLLKHNRMPDVGQLFFNGYHVSPPQTAQYPAMRRRQSSSEATVSLRKPSLNRADTSPTFLGTLGRIMTAGSKTTQDAVTSPRSPNSGSSSNRTIIQADDSLSRTHSSMSRTSASPAHTLGQRTQQLFRRMSNSRSERSEPRSSREKSPLPTLTSTPSSAYTPRKETTKLNAGESRQAPKIANSNADARRPSLQMRTKTEPASGRPSSAALERNAIAPESNNPLTKRAGSVKRTTDTRAPQHIHPPSDGPSEKEGSGTRTIPRRRGSIRDAIGARRPWR